MYNLAEMTVMHSKAVTENYDLRERISLLEAQLQRFKRLTIQDIEHDKLWDECFGSQANPSVSEK